MSAIIELPLRNAGVRQRALTRANLREDYKLHRTLNRDGVPILDGWSLFWAYQKVKNPVRLILHDGDRRLQSVRYTHNLRTNPGGIWMGKIEGGDAIGNSYVASGSQTYAATTVTPTTGPGWTTNQFVDHIVVPYAGGVYGVVIANTPTVLTVDQWTTVGSATGAAGSTPAANTLFVILRGAAPAQWVALSTNATAPNTTDTTLTGEIATADLKRQLGTWSETTTPAGSSTSVNQTETWKHHIVYTLTTTNTGIQKAGMFTAQNSGTMPFENTFAGVNTISGDQLTLDWSASNA